MLLQYKITEAAIILHIFTWSHDPSEIADLVLRKHYYFLCWKQLCWLIWFGNHGQFFRILWKDQFKGIVHFEINFWYVLAYLKGIQDVGVFVSIVVSILIYLG